MAKYWYQARRFIKQRVLHTGDTPHAIALGVGIAMWVAFLPLIGVQTIVAIAIAALFRANKAVCIPIVWITNPFTAVPIFGACFSLGRFLFPSPTGPDEAVVLSELERQHAAGVFELAFWRDLFYRIASLGLELWAGCFIVGTVLGIASYFFARWGVSKYRERRRRHLLCDSLLQSNLRARGAVRSQGPM